MALKAVIESLDDVEENLREFYKEITFKDKEGKAKTVLALDLEAVDSHPGIATLRNAFERVKADLAKNKTDLAEVKAKVEGLPEDFSVDEFTRLKAFETEAKKGDDGDPEKKRAREAEIQSLKNMHTQQLAAITKKVETVTAEKDAVIAKKDETIRKLLVEEGLTKALATAGVKPELAKAAKAMLGRSVKVVESDGDQAAVVETDMGQVPVEEFVTQWAKSDEGKHFVEPPKGGGAEGSGGGGGGSKEPNPFGKAHWNMTAQGKLMAADAAKADRLAKAAGHKDAVSAKQADAK